MSDVFRFQIEDEDQGSRLDSVLSQLLEEVSRSYIQKLIEKEMVSINGKVETSKKLKVKTGDEIELMLPPPKELEILPEDIPINIVYEDRDVIVVDKPKGMVVHPAAGTPSGTLVNAVMHHCGDQLSSINGVIRPGIVHRIDKDTSGLLMIAKSDMAHKCLADQLAEHSVTRVYKALVHDNITEDEGTVDAPIGRDVKNRLRMAVNSQSGRRAVTHYTVQKRFGRYTYVHCRLETGRTHQIRVHMAYIRHPLVGDLVYGPKKPALGAESQALHAAVLGFRHPATGEYMEFESPLPSSFEKLLSKVERGSV